MILLRSFPLSFAIFWRFMLVLPLWVIFYIILTALTFYGVLTFMAEIPILGLLLLIFVPVVATVVTYIISMHPYLIGIRIGLRVLGHKTEPSQHKLMIAAVGYGFVEAIVAVVISAVTFALLLVVMQGSMERVKEITQIRVADPVAVLSQNIAYGRLTAMALISAIVPLVIRAALLPTLAGVAAGRTPHGRPHRPFDEFGAQLPMMLLLLGMIAAVSTFILPYIGNGAQTLGLTDILVSRLDKVILFVSGKNETAFTLLHAFALVLALSLTVWLFALQCAGAALAYDSSVTQPPRPKSAQAVSSTVDIGALRRARMGKRPDQ